MNELKIFQNSDFGELGVMTIDDKETSLLYNVLRYSVILIREKL